MEIKVGDFIRTTDGYIRKIDNINTDKNIITRRGKYILDMPYKNSQSVAENKIVKHSPNIIDLIEEGDYVNGSYCFGKEQDELVIENGARIYGEQRIKQKDIEDVVTKEMFKSVEYRVE